MHPRSTNEIRSAIEQVLKEQLIELKRVLALRERPVREFVPEAKLQKTNYYVKKPKRKVEDIQFPSFQTIVGSKEKAEALLREFLIAKKSLGDLKFSSNEFMGWVRMKQNIPFSRKFTSYYFFREAICSKYNLKNLDLFVRDSLIMKTIIFDIDGTLANISHRLHHIKDGNRNWDSFNAEAGKDVPIPEIVELLNVLYMEGEYRIVLVTGRTEKIRDLTQEWLEKHGVEYDFMYMRPAGDYRKDYIVKKEILGIIRKDTDDDPILFVVDDRPSVVRMWREEGLVCLQVNEWNEGKKWKGGGGQKGLLTLMVGPSGAGKSAWLESGSAKELGIRADMVISTDKIRLDICGNIKDQSRNKSVFEALHRVVAARVESGLPTVVDATNIKRADRLQCLGLVAGSPVRYIVLDRPLPEKLAGSEWKKDELVGGDLVRRHHDIFLSQIGEILLGDMRENVTVLDLRRY